MKRLFLMLVLPLALVTASRGQNNAAVTSAVPPSASAPATNAPPLIREHKSGQWTPGLSDTERATLFAMAEDTLRWCVTSGGRTPFSFDAYELTEKLKQESHTFVTLKKNGDLRGCIGSLPPMSPPPLYRSVHQNAILAALKDDRFKPVTAGELASIAIHLSILGPVAEIKSVDEFKLGEHGIIVEKGHSHGVFLPEVAVEQKWSKEETLNYLCEHKAHLPADAWKQGATLKVFSSVVLEK